MKKANRYRIQGTVQGVGYRIFAKTCADALGLCGWIENNDDGSVEAHAEGEEGLLAEFAFDLSRGARYARVESVDADEAPVLDLDHFKIRR